MSVFVVSVGTTLPPGRAFEAVTDWSAHDGMPLTRVRVTRPTGGVGTRFVARTAVGPIGVDDPMEVVQWQEPDDGHDGPWRPGRCRVRKDGRVLRGGTTIDVRSDGHGGSVVRWDVDLGLGPPWLDRVLGPLTRRVGPTAYRRLVGRLLR